MPTTSSMWRPAAARCSHRWRRFPGAPRRWRAMGRTWRSPRGGRVEFVDVGAIAYFLKAIPWVVEGFGVERDLAALEGLQARLQAGRPLKFTYTRFLIEAVRS